MNKSLIAVLCVLALAVSASAVSTQLDFMDLGVESSEAGHDLQSWSGLWDWGGNYGCADVPNPYSNTLRTIVPKEQTCPQDDKVAYFQMSTTGTAYELKLRHLAGSQNDAYALYYESAPGVWTQLNLSSSADPYICGDGTWSTDSYALPGLTGTVEFKLETFAMPLAGWCQPGGYWCQCYGLNAFSWAELNGTPGSQIPEFSAIAAGIALAGAATGFVLLRRKR